MKQQENIDSEQTNDSVSKLLRQAAPRTPAPQEVRNRAHKNIHAHWRKNVERRRQPKRYALWGLAASLLVLLGVAFVFNNTNTIVPALAVAEVIRAQGNELRFSTQLTEELQPLHQDSALTVGSVIVTGTASSIALRWGEGGSLRVAENSKLKVVGEDRVRLLSGAIYFDSKPDDSNHNLRPRLSVDTRFGIVTHLGTQFITTVSASSLNVSVREGIVEVSDENQSWRSSAGYSLELSLNSDPIKIASENYGPRWDWVQQIAPQYDSEGQSAKSMLEWIGRETGYVIQYQNVMTEKAAASTLLTGMSPLAPMQSLKAIPFATQLRYTLKEGVILVSQEET